MLFLIGPIFVRQSPRRLDKNAQRQRAQKVLALIGSDVFAAQAVADIKATLGKATPRIHFRDPVAPSVRRIVGFGMLFAILVQWCGIIVILSYTKDIFAAVGH